MKDLTKSGIRRLRRTLLPIMALLLALSCTLTAGMYANASTLNGLFGRGERTVRPLEQSEDLDADYYVQAYFSKAEALEAARAVSLQISDEGIVLLKTTGCSPFRAAPSSPHWACGITCPTTAAAAPPPSAPMRNTPSLPPRAAQRLFLL